MTNKTNPKAKAKVSSKTFQDQEIDKLLVKGEEVVLRANLHNAIFWKATAVFILALLLCLIIMPLGVLLLIVSAVMLCIAVLTKHFLLLVVTNKRVLARYGLLQMDVVDIRLSKIESIDLERMLTGHLFGYANVVILGVGQRSIRIPYISNADSFRRFYNELTLAAEGVDEAVQGVVKPKDKDD